MKTWRTLWKIYWKKLSKKNLSSVDMESLNFYKNTKIYINENLNRYFQYLSFRCRELKSSKIINNFKFQYKVFLIKFNNEMGNEITKKINHNSQLYNLFLEFYQAVLWYFFFSFSFLLLCLIYLFWSQFILFKYKALFFSPVNHCTSFHNGVSATVIFCFDFVVQ